MAESRAYCMDCMEAMKQMPDKCFDLAIVDPPYGDALDDEERGGSIGNALEGGSTATRKWKRFNLSGHQARYAPGGAKVQSEEPAGHGQASTVKKS